MDTITKKTYDKDPTNKVGSVEVGYPNLVIIISKKRIAEKFRGLYNFRIKTVLSCFKRISNSQQKDRINTENGGYL